MNYDDNFNDLRLQEVDNITKIKYLQDKQLKSVVSTFSSKEKKDQVECSLVRDTIELAEDDSTFYKQFIDHMLQMNSICLKKDNENKGDVDEINTITFGDTGVTKEKNDERKSNI